MLDTSGKPVRSRALAALLLSALMLAHAPQGAAVTEDTGTTIDYPTGRDVVVLRYTERIAGIGNPDCPSVSIYGDGRAIVHYPDYTKRGGDYQVHLSAAEMDRLIGLVVTNGVLAFDPDVAHRAKGSALAARHRAARAAGRQPETFRVLDDSTTIIEINLERSAAGRASDVVPVRKRISWYGVQSDAQAYPEVESLRGLAEVEQELRGLLRNPGAARVEP